MRLAAVLALLLVALPASAQLAGTYAIPGDYEITLRGRSEDATDTVVLRVTVDQSTIWGWLGIVLVIAVLGALMGLFWKLGRR